MSRYWLTPAYEAGFDDKVADINGANKQALERAKQGQHTESVDEMTGVQALERKHPDLPMSAGKVELREFEYKRHGTLSFTCNFDVAHGELVACTASRPATKRISWNISNAVLLQTHWPVNGTLSAIISTRICLHRWCAMSQKNQTMLSIWA